MKDPALLWYWGDWYSGTSLMSRFLKGCYIDLLHAQFNHGHLSLEEIKICLGADFGQSWPTLRKKFKQDTDGLFFNERLEREQTKRANFVESRKNGRAGRKKSYDKSYDSDMINHTVNHTENENEIENEIREKGGMGEKELLVPQMQKVWLSLFPDYLDLTETDYPALLQIAQMICKADKKRFDVSGDVVDHILRRWGEITRFCSVNNHYSTYSIERISKHFQSLLQAIHNGNSEKSKKSSSKLGGLNQIADQIRDQLTTRGKNGLGG